LPQGLDRWTFREIILLPRATGAQGRGGQGNVEESSMSAVKRPKMKSKKPVQKKDPPDVSVGNLRVVADWVRDNLMQAHRGTFVEGSRLVVFDNGGIGHPWTVHQLELVLAWLRKAGYTVEGVASCSDGFTWVAVAEADPDLDPAPIEEMLWSTWRKVAGAEKDPDYNLYKAAQHQAALVAVLERPRLPKRVAKVLSCTKSR
jgi:hypothetical protein